MQNQHLADIVVYVIVNGTRYRLGAVRSFQLVTFRMPGVVALPADVELFAYAMSTNEKFQSISILVVPGDEIVLTFENTAQFSSVLRR